jgi:hypothetical protein
LISQRDVAAEGKTLYVKGFPDVVDTDAIKSQFEAFGEVTKVVLFEEPGKAFIFFSSPEHVDRAVASAYSDSDDGPYSTRTTMAFSLTPKRPFVCVMRVSDWQKRETEERLEKYQRAQSIASDPGKAV